MANRTDPLAMSVHGTNPQFLFSKIIRNKIYQQPYWKQHCFGLTAESIIDKAVELDYVGGTYGGNRKPSPFLCLTLKLLQIQPSKDIIVEYIRNSDFKYLRALGSFYLRLTGSHKDIFTTLEPILSDYRKIRMRLQDGRFQISHMDEFIDECLRSENMLDIDLPGLVKREVLENIDVLIFPRPSALDQDVYIEGINTESDYLITKKTDQSPTQIERDDKDNKTRRKNERRHRYPSSLSSTSSNSSTSTTSSVSSSVRHRDRKEDYKKKHKSDLQDKSSRRHNGYKRGRQLRSRSHSPNRDRDTQRHRKHSGRGSRHTRHYHPRHSTSSESSYYREKSKRRRKHWLATKLLIQLQTFVYY